MALLKLSEQYSFEWLESACAMAMDWQRGFYAQTQGTPRRNLTIASSHEAACGHMSFSLWFSKESRGSATLKRMTPSVLLSLQNLIRRSGRSSALPYPPHE
jgi:hypothetical protein